MRIKAGMFLLGLLSTLVLIVAGCGGGGGGGSAPTVSGTASEGALITGKTVKLKDATGKSAPDTITDATTGKYSVDVSGLTAPFLLSVTGVNGTYLTLAPSAGTANLNPITTTVVALAADTPDMPTLFTNLTPDKLAAIKANYSVKATQVTASLQALLPAGVKTEDYFTGAVSAGTGMDAVFDSYQITISPAAGVVISTKGGTAATVLNIPAYTVMSGSGAPLPTATVTGTTPPVVVPPATAPSVSITKTNTGQFQIQGQAMDGVAGVDMVLSYDPSVMTSPGVTQSTGISGALMATNTSMSGKIHIAFVSLTPFSSNLNIATVSFTTQQQSANLTLDSAKFVNSQGSTIN